MNNLELWKRYQQHLCRVPALDLTLDISRMTFGEDYFGRLAGPMNEAFNAIK